MFVIFISTLISLATYFELETREMTREDIELELFNTNNTEAMEEMRISDEDLNLVNTRADIFFHPTYSQIVRLLFNFMASQVSPG